MFNREADRVANYWDARGGITQELFEAGHAKHGGATRILIFDNEVS